MYIKQWSLVVQSWSQDRIGYINKDNISANYHQGKLTSYTTGPGNGHAEPTVSTRALALILVVYMLALLAAAIVPKHARLVETDEEPSQPTTSIASHHASPTEDRSERLTKLDSSACAQTLQHWRDRHVKVHECTFATISSQLVW